MSKRVAIVGFGAEGRSSYVYFEKQGYDVTIVDENSVFDAPPDAKLITGKDALDKLEDFDIVVRSPGVPLHRIKTNGEITSNTKEFFRVCKTKNIIGITGSKGKGTTTMLVWEMLKRAGKQTYIGGNIGKPALDLLETMGGNSEEIVVLELSSFQLWDLDASPHIAVVLMVEPEHLERHKDLDDYLGAKTNIVAHQKPNDLTIYLPNNQYIERIVAKSTAGKKIPYTVPPGAHVAGGWIEIEGNKVCPIDGMVLVGQHNIDNACAAVTVAWQYTQNIDAIAKTLGNFRGLPHRLQFVAETGGVKYYDDSIATTPGSAIAALRSFAQPKIIILGGSDKGADFAELAQEVTKSDVKEAVLIGEMRFKLQTALKQAGFNAVTLFDEQNKMSDIVAHTHNIAEPGDVVVLSPACASFDMFKSYTDRGEQFINAVNDLRSAE
jgi:UDP-N-acetylmuramoylalanine--D-glutamate ligase